MRERLEPDFHMAGPQPSLVEQAEGLGRAEAMRRVIGPALTEFMGPIYDTEISSEEAELLPPIFRLRDVQRGFMGQAQVLLNERRCTQKENDPSSYVLINELCKTRRDLFYYQGAKYVIDEGLLSSLSVPLTVATHIYRLENPNDDHLRSRLNHESFIEAIERDSFDKILGHLAKGPNGFLGRKSTWPEVMSPDFFEFRQADINGVNEFLNIENAYKIETGKVVDLSDEYHLAAHTKRRVLKKQHQVGTFGDPHASWRHQVIVSSGCPLRHSYGGESGEIQEPLMLAAKKFLIVALKVSADKSSHDKIDKLAVSSTVS